MSTKKTAPEAKGNQEVRPENQPDEGKADSPKPTAKGAVDIIAADRAAVLALLHAIGADEDDTVLQALGALETDLETLAYALRSGHPDEADRTLYLMAFRAKAIAEIHRALTK